MELNKHAYKNNIIEMYKSGYELKFIIQAIYDDAKIYYDKVTKKKVREIVESVIIDQLERRENAKL